MVRGAEAFFSSLGFAPLPDTFYQRSLFTKPADHDVECHASAWDLDAKDDLRIKMCIQRTVEEFSVIHHELGHNYCQRAYKDQPVNYQESANDGFHEAIGDTIALSVTPDYLKQIGLLDKVPDEPIMDRETMRQHVFEYIEVDYNKTRRHSALGYLSPENFELKNSA